MYNITEFQSSLLRERFVISDPKTVIKNKAPITALSNRMEITLISKRSQIAETFVIRTHNMHSCVRFASRLFQAYNHNGPILHRAPAYDWEQTWHQVEGDYERDFNPKRWIAVYSRGVPIYQFGQHHALLDVIEKCAFENDQTYDKVVGIAEEAFKNNGKALQIEHDSNVALVINFTDHDGRCGIMLRGATSSNTFNFKVSSKDDITISIPHCLSTCAAFLEGIQLAFVIGTNKVKIKVDNPENRNNLIKQNQEAKRRLSRLEAEISNLEEAHSVRYRPEKPDFAQIMIQAERMAAQGYVR